MEQLTAERAGPAAPTALGSRRATIALIVSAVFLYWVSLYIYVPTLPTYVQSKTSDLAAVGVVLAQYGLWQAIVRLPVGILCDWLGRRKVFVVGGFLVTALGSWMLGAANSAAGLLVGRAVTGVACATWVPLVVLFSGLFPPHEAVRASAILALVGSVAKVLSTGVNGSLNNLGGYSLAFFLAAGAAVLAAVLAVPVREQPRPRNAPSLSSIARVCLCRDVMLPSLLSMVAQYANFAATFGFIPILARRMGAGDVAQSLLVSGNLAVVALGNVAASAIANRVGARNLVYASFASLALGLGAAALAPSFPLLVVAQLFMGLCQGIGYPVLMGLSIRYVDDGQRSTAMGLHQAVYAIGMFAGPWLSGLLADAIGIQPTFGVTAVGCLVLGMAGTRLLARGAEQRAR